MAHGTRARPGTGRRLLDDFADPAAWTLSATDDVKAALRPAAGAARQRPVHRLRLRPGHRLRERAASLADRLSGALRVRAATCAAMRRPTRCSSSSSTRAATTCGGRTGPTTAFRATGRRIGFASARSSSPGARRADRAAAAHRLGRAGDRLGQRRRQGQRLLRPAQLRELPAVAADAAGADGHGGVVACPGTRAAHALDGHADTDWQPERERAAPPPC